MAITDDEVPEGSPAPDQETEESSVPLWRRNAGKWFAGVAIASFVAMWGYVLVLAVFEGRQPPIDRIGDTAFAEAGEARCAEAVAAVAALPTATASPTPTERADVLDEANAIFSVMVDDLDDLTSLIPDDGDRDLARQWLGDWEIYLGDRAAHAERLHTGEDSRLLVSPKEGEGRHITGWIDEFALANRMDSCVSPDDA